MKKILFVLILLAPFIGFAKDDFPTKTDRYVNDFTGKILSGPQVNALERKLHLFNDSTKTQIVIVIMASIGDYDVADYGVQLGEKWGIGQKGKDNGVLILLAIQERKVTIQIGYGLEGVAPDMVVKTIIDQEMTPNFKEGNYFLGLQNATNVLMSLARKDFPASEYVKRGNRQSSPVSFLAIIVFVIIVIVFISRFRRVSNYASTNNLGFWAAWLLLMNMGGGSSGRWNDFNSGGGGFGGGGDSGGGFGGGSFGGGGASGSW